MIRPALLLLPLLPLLSAPTLLPQDGDALVIVNGRSISRDRVQRVLMDAYGLEIMQQMIIAELVRQATRDAGLRVTKADFEAERQADLDRIARKAGMDPEEATPSNKQKALETVLEQKGISTPEYLMAVERNAHLRKLVEKDFVIEDKTLREEFARTYGERVRVRHIQVAVHNPGRLNDVDALVRGGADFAKVAREMSANVETAPRGGELPPFTFDEPSLDPLMREAAFSLKVGEISNPVRTGQFYHIIKLEERIAPDNVRFEEVRGEVERNLRERVIPDEMGKLAAELFRKANIRVLDPAMKVRYDEFLEGDEEEGG